MFAGDISSTLPARIYSEELQKLPPLLLSKLVDIEDVERLTKHLIRIAVHLAFAS